MKMIVIADDFTGANDTGVQLAKRVRVPTWCSTNYRSLPGARMCW